MDKLSIMSGVAASVKWRETHYQHFQKTVWRAPWSEPLLHVYHLSVPQFNTLMFLSLSTHLSSLAPSLTVYHRSLAQTLCRQSGCVDSLECCSRLWHDGRHKEKMFVNSAQIAAPAAAGDKPFLYILFPPRIRAQKTSMLLFSLVLGLHELRCRSYGWETGLANAAI